MSDPHHELESTSAAAPGMTPGHTHCANCGAPLHGPFCHQCGQSTKNMLRHVPALTADAAESLFGLDGRLVHTLPALYVKPGFLAREYFAGRRMRYIPPFRLMFFMSVLAFLMIHLALNLDRSLWHVNLETPLGVMEATPAQVRTDLELVQTRIDTTRAKPDQSPLTRLTLGLAAHTAPVRATRRLRQLDATPIAAASIPAPPSTAALAARFTAITDAPSKAMVKSRAHALSTAIDTTLDQIGKASAIAVLWLRNLRDTVSAARHQGLARFKNPGTAQATSKPAVTIPAMDAIKVTPKDTHFHMPRTHAGWLPAFVRHRFNTGMQHAETNMRAMFVGSSASRSQARHQLTVNILSVTPQTLFVLIPLLALLLKLMYAFKSRLYIEHLIVALYSHAFIFLTLLLSVALGLITMWLPGWANAPGGWLQAALWIWLPIYLLMMQKRVYAQGWFFTAVKYGVTGVCYVILLSFALTTAALIGLAS